MQAIPYTADLHMGVLSQCAVHQTRIPPKGTAMGRPSSRPTDTVSSVTVTLMRLGRVNVTTAEGVPGMSQGLQLLVEKALDVT